MKAEHTWRLWRRVLREPALADAVVAGDVRARAADLGLTPAETEIAAVYAENGPGVQWAVDAYRYRLLRVTRAAVAEGAPLTARALRQLGHDPDALVTDYVTATGWADRGPYVYTVTAEYLHRLDRTLPTGPSTAALRDVLRLERTAAELIARSATPGTAPAGGAPAEPAPVDDDLAEPVAAGDASAGPAPEPGASAESASRGGSSAESAPAGGDLAGPVAAGDASAGPAPEPGAPAGAAPAGAGGGEYRWTGRGAVVRWERDVLGWLADPVGGGLDRAPERSGAVLVRLDGSAELYALTGIGAPAARVAEGLAAGLPLAEIAAGVGLDPADAGLRGLLGSLAEWGLLDVAPC
ncbi:hypothetical protein [Kitasatospora fiedleri]|uniref:hypothetical protein n=1 Tax=Kitasatospora fiedleri TaxID=2991545 RepID=UPI00249AF966|nr:hypothetical protein [Kitasatospora fiedleri]